MSRTPSPAPVPALVRVRLDPREAARCRIPAFLLFVLACSHIALALRAFVHDWLIHYRRHDAYQDGNFAVWEAIGGEITGTAWLHLGIALAALGLVVWIFSRRRVPSMFVFGLLLLPLLASGAVLFFGVAVDPAVPRDPRLIGSLRRFALAPPTLIVHAVALVVFVAVHRWPRRGPDLEAIKQAF